MASTVRIKRSGVTGAPPTLAQGELAYSYLAYDPMTGQGGDRLYIGTGTETNGEAANIEVIGGKYFTSKLDHAPGTLTSNSAIIVDSDSKIDQIKIDSIVIDANTISTAVANTNLTLIPGGGKTVDVSGAKISSLGTPTANTDAATKAYVDGEIASVQSSSEFDYATDDGFGSLNLATETFTLLGGTGISTSANSGTDTITISLDDTGVIANTYGSSTEIPVLTINAQGQITLANTASISTDLSFSGDTGSSTLSLISDTLNFSGGTGVTTAVSNNTVEFSIGQDVSTTANVSFVAITANTITATTSVEAGDVLISGNSIATTSNTALVLDALFVSVNDTLIKDVADPQTLGDAANKRYVDEVAQGLKVRQAAWVLVDDPLAATYDPNGYETGWATLTASSVGAFPAVDDIASGTLNVQGARILLTAQTNAAHNGLYVVETPGDGSTAWVLRRCGSCRTSEQIPGSFVFVQQGTVYENTGWVATVADVTTFVIGTDSITWTQFSGAGTFTAGNGLDLSGNVFSVNVDGSSIEIVSDTLQVANGGITNEMLAGSIANDKLVNSSISFSADSGNTDPVFLGETIAISGNGAISTTVSNNAISISVDDAGYTTKGVASFSNTDFVVTSGAVELRDEAIQDIIGATIFGGTAITVTYDSANNVLEVSADLATTSTVGAASFSANNFAVSLAGQVTVTNIDGGEY